MTKPWLKSTPEYRKMGKYLDELVEKLSVKDSQVPNILDDSLYRMTKEQYKDKKDNIQQQGKRCGVSQDTIWYKLLLLNDEYINSLESKITEYEYILERLRK